MEVDLRRFDGLVSAPERDRGLINPMLKQLHRSAVPQRVGTDALTPGAGGRIYRAVMSG